MPNADPHALLALSLRLLCLGVLLRSIQLLLNGRELSDARLLGWDPAARARKGLAWALRALLSYPGCILLLCLQTAAAAVGLAVALDTHVAAWLVGSLFLAQAWFNYRFTVVYHAADTMFLIGFGAVFAATLDPADPWLPSVALLFLGLQVLLAYVLSGWSKVTSSVWRDGSHLVAILRDSTFRMEPCGRWLAAHPGTAKAVARSVIALELLFPLSLLTPAPVFTAVLVGGALFHAGVAFFMGLPGFFWAFVATYPALCFLQQRLQTFLAT